MSTFHLGLLALAIAPSIVALVALPASPSRRRLVVALSVWIPVAGPMLAVMVVRARGRGKLEERGDHSYEDYTADDSIAAIRRMGEMPSLPELLISRDSGDRQSALVVLSSQADTRAVTMLRWAVDNGSPEAVLDAALTLSELDVRFERDLAEAEARLATHLSVEHLLETANTLSRAIRSGLADPAIAVGLAARARELYGRASALPDARAYDADVALAYLEVSLGNGRAALASLHRATQGQTVPPPELRRLHEHARFCARVDGVPGPSPNSGVQLHTVPSREVPA